MESYGSDFIVEDIAASASNALGRSRGRESSIRDSIRDSMDDIVDEVEDSMIKESIEGGSGSYKIPNSFQKSTSKDNFESFKNKKFNQLE